MKGLNVLAAFLGGAAVELHSGILFAPRKRRRYPKKLQKHFKKKGIKLNRTDMEDLVDEIAAEIKK